jgi:hypothetical protein
VTTPARSRFAEQPELRDRLIGYIAQRDRVEMDRAKAIFAALSIPDLTILEMQARQQSVGFTSDYDPLGR